MASQPQSPTRSSNGHAPLPDEIAELLAGGVGEAIARIIATKEREFGELVAHYRSTLAELRVAIAEERIKFHAVVNSLTEGKAGPPGRDGEKGEAGRDGLAGLAGRDGKDGAQGPPGQGFDELDVSFDGERAITFKLAAGKIKTFALAMPLYRGVYRAGEDYARGDCVTYGGSLFAATRDTKEQPEKSRDWTLAVKRGENK